MNDVTNDELVLSNEGVCAIATLLQLAILTGTDVFDWFRMMKFSREGSELVLSDSYRKVLEAQIKDLEAQAKKFGDRLEEASGATQA